jgi:hypothetical protein
MFCLSVVDHVRLNFGHVAQNYTVHAEAAERLAGFVIKARMTILVLLGITAAAIVAGILRPARNFEISAAIAAGVTLVVYVVHVALGLEARVHAHRSCAHRLWLVSERYRSLLAELQDGLVDAPTLLRRRDDLIEQVHAAYDQAFPMDQRAFESIRLTSGGSVLTDEEIDRLLPPSLHRHAATQAA